VNEPVLFVGVDGGGSHTIALAGPSGRDLLGRGEAGPSNPSALGFEAATAAIGAAVRQALAQALAQTGAAAPAPPDPTDVAGAAARITMGVAGAGRPADGARLAGLVASEFGLPAARVRVLQDVALLLPAAGLSSGIAIVAGTGSSVFGVAPDGRAATAGGWGYLLGDEGSAFFVGREALLAVARAEDGTGQPTALTEAALGHYRVATPRDLITAVYQSAHPRTAIADLAPTVVETAAGDPTARAILASGASELGRCAIALATRLGLRDPPVVAVGGMFRAGALMLDPLAAELSAAGLQPPRLLEAEPALGALRLAAGELPEPRPPG
jgi:N-acetylglucosamine kinase-like BadF-type ATPase